MLINLELQSPQLNAVGLVLNPVGADWLVACPARFERATYGLEGVKIYLKNILECVTFLLMNVHIDLMSIRKAYNKSCLQQSSKKMALGFSSFQEKSLEFMFT